MRVGIDARAAAEVPAGRGRYVRELVRHLARLDTAHELVLYGRRRWDAPDVTATWRLIRTPDPVWAIEAGLRASRECDVFLATNTYLATGLLRIPSVAVVHDLASFDRRLRTPRGSLAERATLAVAVRRARALICVSDATRRALVERFPAAAGKARAIPLAAGELFARPLNCDAVLQRHGLSGPYVLAVGTLEPRKNLPRLVEAFAGLPDEIRSRYRLAVVGKPGWDTAETLRSIESSQVVRLGYVPDAELPCIYRGAELFVYPSLHEGFGLPVLEAMTAGTAVLTSNVSSLPEVGGDAAEYSDPLDVGDIRARMLELLTDAGRRAELVERGHARSREFGWERTARRTLEAIELAAES